MTHLTEGEIVALRDRATLDTVTDAGDHLASCAACGDALSDARARAAAVTAALEALDDDFDVEPAWGAVRARIARASARTDAAVQPLPLPPSGVLWHLGRAAGVMLVVAGAAAALPGSPLHSWLWDAREAPASAGEAAVEAADVEGRTSEPTAVRVEAGAGPVLVSLRGVAAGDLVEVRWVPGTQVAVFAPAGSAFSSAEGRIEATVVPGSVRVELPRGIVPASLEVSGRMFLQSTSAGVQVTGPVETRDDDVIRFRLPEG